MVIPNLFPRPDASNNAPTADFVPSTFADISAAPDAVLEESARGAGVTIPNRVDVVVQDTSEALISVLGIGRRSVRAQRLLLNVVLIASSVILIPTATYRIIGLDTQGRQLETVSQALLNSQRLSASVGQAMLGTPQAFADLAESSSLVAKSFDGLKNGNPSQRLQPLSGAARTVLEQANPLVERANASAAAILAQQKILEQIGLALVQINRQSEDLLELTKTISSMKQQQGASPSDISAVGELSTLTQRIGKSANEFLTSQGASAESVFLLGKDLNSFKDIAQGLLNGSGELRLNATADKPTRDKFVELIRKFDESRTQASAILNNLQALISVRQAQTSVIKDSEPLRKSLEKLQIEISEMEEPAPAIILELAPLALLVLLSAPGKSSKSGLGGVPATRGSRAAA